MFGLEFNVTKITFIFNKIDVKKKNNNIGFIKTIVKEKITLVLLKSMLNHH